MSNLNSLQQSGYRLKRIPSFVIFFGNTGIQKYGYESGDLAIPDSFMPILIKTNENCVFLCRLADTIEMTDTRVPIAYHIICSKYIQYGNIVKIPHSRFLHALIHIIVSGFFFAEHHLPILSPTISDDVHHGIALNHQCCDLHRDLDPS